VQGVWAYGRMGVWAYGRMVACMFALGTVELTIMAVGGVLVLVLIVWLLVKSARRDPQRK
jgi:type IV secretory pathway TrbD component